jgi:hypothetical protein
VEGKSERIILMEKLTADLISVINKLLSTPNGETVYAKELKQLFAILSYYGIKETK